MDLKENLKIFDEYVKNFTIDVNIKMQINHTYHVVDLAKKIAKMMELNEEDTNLIMTIALLHDIGRFKQYQENNSYDDYKTKFDHALCAVDYLFKENHIEDYKVDSKYYDIIKFAIRNHNKLKIEKNGDKRYIFFAKLIRDIDKIDIFRILASNDYDNFLEPFSKGVKKYFEKQKCIPINLIKNKSDSFLYHLSYIFDVNFQESFELLNDTDNLGLYLSTIDVHKYQEKEYQEIKDKALDYIEKRGV